MTSKIVYFDIETDGINPTRTHCVHFLTENGVGTTWTYGQGYPGLKKTLETYKRNDYTFVGHNVWGFDIPVIEKFTGFVFPDHKVIDTFVLSRLIDFNAYRTHSLGEIGSKLGVFKGEFKGPWDKLTEEMLDYCKQDVVVTKVIYNNLKLKPYSVHAYENEAFLARFCYRMKSNGFPYNVNEAKDLLAEITADMARLESKFDFSLPDKELKRIKFRKKADGSLYSSVQKAMYENPKNFTMEEGKDGPEVVVWGVKEFNPRSSKDRVTVLNRAGWKPVEKTKGHLDFERKIERWKRKGGKPTRGELEKLENYSEFGWKVNETNLNTLPSTANEATRSLAEWLTLEGRRSSLEECIGQYNPDTGCIHANFWHIGAWTQRMSHSGPNMANIPSPFSGSPETPVENVKHKYDKELRALWNSGGVSKYKLVGCDADGIQLRILAHYLNDPDFTKEVTKGTQADGTDVHTMNMKRLGSVCRDRDTAKTFIYAFLLGAGVERVSIILGCSKHEAQKAMKRFVESIPALEYLKKHTIPEAARKGYFIGLDGRKVYVKSEHLVLAGMLQAGEKVVMTVATKVWADELDRAGLDYTPVNFVHDEWQTIAHADHAEDVGLIQAGSLKTAGANLGLNCPISGSYQVGWNWAETH